MAIVSRNWIKWFIIIIVLIGPLIPFYFINNQWNPMEQAYQSEAVDFLSYHGDLTLQDAMHSSNEWREFDQGNYGSIRETGTYWFKMTMPENLWRNPNMYIVYLRNGDVFLEGQRIYSFNIDLRNNQIGITQPQLFQLPDDFSGKELYIRSTFEEQFIHPGVHFIEEPLNIILQQLIKSGYLLALGFISLLIAIVSMMMYVGRRQRVYVYFSLFALVVVYASLYHSWGLFSIVIPWPTFTYIYNIVILFGGYCFLRFFAEVFGDRTGSIHRRLWQIVLALLIVMTITAIAAPAFYSFEMTRYVFDVISPIILLAVIITSLVTYRRNKDQESFWYMAGFVVFSVFIAYSFLYFRIDGFVSQYAAPIYPFIKAVSYPVFKYYLYMHGVFVLMFCMMMILRERIRGIYLKATQTAADLAVLSESLEQLVRERTAELEDTNVNLRASMLETSQALTEVAVLEDRNRIAQDMHDHIGHDLTAALIQMEAVKMLITKDASLAIDKINATRTTVNQGLESIRETVQMMKIDYEKRAIIPELQHVIQTTYLRTGVTIDYDPQPLPDLNASVKKALIHALQEGLTNGIRHGKAAHFIFELKARDELVYFMLSNKGRKYVGDSLGFGLKTMKERVEQLSGSLCIDDNDGTGCKLTIEIPKYD